jgi:uncharacterized repeat protein (TIGR04138 family)
MSDESHAIFELLRRDKRYKLEAYQFVREGLSYGQRIMEMGEIRQSEEELSEVADELSEVADELSEVADELSESEDWEPPAERHLTGQELCEAIRRYAIEQYGLMAKVVLNNWGLHKTGDFGEIVYNLIEIGMMKKSKTDRREDFENVYDFDRAFNEQFEIKITD